MSDSGHPQGDDYLLKVDNPLVVPVDRKVRIITTASDVIHAWGVPSLGVKQDAIPGFVRDTWFRAAAPGDYYGQCFELCGKEHAYMPIHVKVLSQADYTTWASGKIKEAAARADDPSKVWELPALAARGEQIYTANCQVCHQANGKGGGNIKALDGSPTVLDADKTKQIHVAAERPEQRRDAVVEAALGHRDRGGRHLHQEPLVERHRPDRAAERSRHRTQVAEHSRQRIPIP